MPLPAPKKGQEKKDFINSCMASPTMNQEYKDPKQRLAVCHSQYTRSSNATTWSEIEFDNYLLLK
jgi:hypothetical protein|tara:strand:- start:120 stop:314 length:195 start_codon:yes stop_codon:yes gene_type:complete